MGNIVAAFAFQVSFFFKKKYLNSFSLTLSHPPNPPSYTDKNDGKIIWLKVDMSEKTKDKTQPSTVYIPATFLKSNKFVIILNF